VGGPKPAYVVAGSELPQDLLSQVNGAKDGVTFCGPRKIEYLHIEKQGALADSTLVSFDVATSTFTLEASLNSQSGDYDVYFSVSLVDYPDLPSQEFSFPARVNPDCLAVEIQQFQAIELSTLALNAEETVQDVRTFFSYVDILLLESYCGPLELSLETPPAYLVLSGDKSELTYSPTKASNPGYSQLHNLRVGLRDHPALFSLFEFEATSTGCLVEALYAFSTQNRDDQGGRIDLAADAVVFELFRDPPLTLDFSFEDTEVYTLEST